MLWAYTSSVLFPPLPVALPRPIVPCLLLLVCGLSLFGIRHSFAGSLDTNVQSHLFPKHEHSTGRAGLEPEEGPVDADAQQGKAEQGKAKIGSQGRRCERQHHPFCHVFLGSMIIWKLAWTQSKNRAGV